MNQLNQSNQLRNLFGKIKKFFGKTIEILIENFILFFLIFFFLILISVFLFIQHIFSTANSESEILEKPPVFEEKIFQRILEIWQNKEKRFQESDSKKYSDIF